VKSVRLGVDAVLWVALAVATFAAALQLIVARPRVEGVDFYYYLCVARDLADGIPTRPIRHFYFPGVYRFWQGVFASVGRSLPEIQSAYVVLLAANALAVAAVVWRGVRRTAPALLAGVWYLALCLPLEAFGGVTEPLATLPVLAGLAVWGGEPLVGRAGLARAAVLGAGLGLGVYARQLGGLLALGALTLPLVNLVAPPERRHRWTVLAAVPATALLVVLVGIAAEGEGLTPLRIGLSALSGYPATGSFRTNLLWFAKNAPMLCVFTVATLALFAWLLEPRWRPLLSERWAALAGFALLAGLAAFVQYSRRAYLHYALLAAPLLVAAAMLSATALVRRFPARMGGWPETVLVALVLARLLAMQSALLVPPDPWRAQPEIAADLEALKEQLRPGEDLLVLPPRRNEFHFLLGTRSQSFAQGYSWAPGPGSIEAAVRNPELDAVLVLRRHLDPSDIEAWRSLDCDRGVAALAAAGFRPVSKLRTSTLLRRGQEPIQKAHPAAGTAPPGSGLTPAASITSWKETASSRRNSSMSGSEVASVSSPT
jgi:hypothetical protein